MPVPVRGELIHMEDVMPAQAERQPKAAVDRGDDFYHLEWASALTFELLRRAAGAATLYFEQHLVPNGISDRAAAAVSVALLHSLRLRQCRFCIAVSLLDSL